MQVTINGEPQQVSAGTSVALLLEQLELDRRQVAVEVNRRIVPREEHAGRRLEEGDELEIVTLVGGG